MPRLGAVRILVASAVALVAVSVLAPVTAAVAQETVPATPVCPAGTTLMPSGYCERPADATCPTGLTVSGDQCVAPSWCPTGATGPDRGTCTDPNGPNGPRMTRVSCPANSQAIGDSNTCTAPVHYSCPSGLTLNSRTCRAHPTWKCPPGATLSGQTCTLPAKAAAAAPTTTATTAPATVAAAGKPSRSGLQLAATGSSRSQSNVALAGWALAVGGLLLALGAEPLRRRARRPATD